MIQTGAKGPVVKPHQFFATLIEVGDIELVAFEIASPPVSRPELSASENAVVALVIQGYPTGRIASARGVSYRTVANQLASVYRKLSLSSRAELLSALRSR